MTVYAFVNEPELLRDALLLAHREGVMVILARIRSPDQVKERHHERG